jgi:hypothetical protein
VIEAESQAMLNTLTEHDFQDAFKKWQKLWGWCAEGPTLREMVANNPKVSFWPDGSTSPGNYGWLFVCPLLNHCVR